MTGQHGEELVSNCHSHASLLPARLPSPSSSKFLKTGIMSPSSSHTKAPLGSDDLEEKGTVVFSTISRM